MVKEQHINFPGHPPMTTLTDLAPLMGSLWQLISEARSRVLHAVDEIQVQTCWQISRGFDKRNLRHMQAFFLAFPIWNAVRSKLSWTHYLNKLFARVQ